MWETLLRLFEKADLNKPSRWIFVLAPIPVLALLLRFGPSQLVPDFTGKIGDLSALVWFKLALAFVLSILLWCSFLVCIDYFVKVMRLAGKIEQERNKESADQAAFSDEDAKLYSSLDPAERAALALFIDRGQYSLSEEHFRHGKDPALPLGAAMRRLEHRRFAFYNPGHERFGPTWFLENKHFRKLSMRPDLVGSQAVPRAFGD